MDNKKLIEELRRLAANMPGFEHILYPAANAIEEAEVEKRELYQMGTVEKCKRFHTQNCHECPDLDCCDNTSPAMERIKELEAELERTEVKVPSGVRMEERYTTVVPLDGESELEDLARCTVKILKGDHQMSQEKFEEWAIVELFGHQRMAGRVSEQQIGGETFIRVDVPETSSQPGFTQLLGKGAIYRITLTDEKSARAAAMSCSPAPVTRWELDEVIRKQRLLSSPGEREHEEEDYDVG